MSFSRAKPTGWGFNEKLTSDEMNQIDIDHVNAIDGANGGTYANANPIIVSGLVQLAACSTLQRENGANAFPTLFHAINPSLSTQQNPLTSPESIKICTVDYLDTTRSMYVSNSGALGGNILVISRINDNNAVRTPTLYVYTSAGSAELYGELHNNEFLLLCFWMDPNEIASKWITIMHGSSKKIL